MSSPSPTPQYYVPFSKFSYDGNKMPNLNKVAFANGSSGSTQYFCVSNIRLV